MQTWQKHWMVAGVLLGSLLLSPETPSHAQSLKSDPIRNRIKIRKRTEVEKPRSSHEQDEDFNLERAKLLNQKRQGLISDIKKFTQSARPGSAQAAELQLRLGSLYMEDYYAQTAIAQSEFDEQQKQFEAGRIKKAPVLNRTKATASLKAAREIYSSLVKKYPKHERADEMFYFLALSSMDQGKTNEAVHYFDALVHNRPTSKFAADAYLQLGDFHFENNRFKLAEGFYDQSIARKSKNLLAYSQYKKAWCAYNQQDFERSIAAFKKVLSLAHNGNSGAMRLRNETMRDIALPMADLKMKEDAISFFKTEGEPFETQGIETMAGQYYEQGSYALAIYFYETLLQKSPGHPKAPQFELNIVDCLKLSHHEQEAISRLLAAHNRYSGSSSWMEANASDEKIAKNVEKDFEEFIRKFALQIHVEAQKMKNSARYASAKSLYSHYLEHFPRTEHSANISFHLAEILFKQRSFYQAARRYHGVFDDPAASASLKEKSIRYAIASLDEQINEERKKQGLQKIGSKVQAKLKMTEGEAATTLPYSETEEKFRQVTSVYLKNYPKAADAPDVLYSKAYLAYVHRDFAKAYAGFSKMIKTAANHPMAIPSAHLILDILNHRGSYDRLITVARKFLENPQLKQPEFRREVADILRKAELKRIQALEKDGKFQEAALAYVEYTKAFGTQDESLYEKALYNASINFTKATLLTQAAETQEKFLRRFPKSPHRKQMLLELAKTYESLAQYKKAGEYFYQFSESFPSDSQSESALRLAGLYLGGSGHSERAESILKEVVRRYPNQRAAATQDWIEMLENINDRERLTKLYLELRASRGVTYGEYLDYTLRLAELHASERGQLSPRLMQEAESAVQKFSKQMMTSPNGVEALAKFRFWNVLQRDKVFRSISLAVNPEKLTSALQRKIALLKELEVEYGKVARIGSANWGLAAMFRTASAYEHIAEAVAAAPVPSELTAEQLETYRNEIRKTLIEPFEEKSKTLAINCLDKAQDFNVLSKWTSGCYGVAARFSPETFPNVRTFSLTPHRLALAAPTEKTPTLEVGDIKTFPYPLYSSAIFEPNRVPATAMSPNTVKAYSLGSDEKGSLEPKTLHYRWLSSKRQKDLESALDSVRPSEDDVMNFAYLNLLRLAAPKKAIPKILQAVEKNPKVTTLHGLLALAYLEAGDFPAARMVLLSLVAQGHEDAATLNNLGVLSSLEGREDRAISYFKRATQLPNSGDARVNLGFLGLQYRNGFEAKEHFQKAAKTIDDDVTLKLGQAIAAIQNRELDRARDQLKSIAGDQPHDPFARLSLGYFLLDVDHEALVARKMTREFMDSEGLEDDIDLRQLVSEAQTAAIKSSSTDDIH